MKLFYGFALAFNMLTILPFFKVHTFFKGINGYSAMFYPLVGFLIGAILWGVHSLLQTQLPPAHLAVLIFTLWILLTGALHLDGLSDTIDGLFVSKERAFEVMKDAHVGGMGMIFTFAFLALKLSSLIYFEAYYLLPVLLMISRLNATLAIYFFPYASKGVGALLKEELSLKMVLFALFYSCVLVYFFSFGTAFFLSLLVGLLCAAFFVKRLGGLSGDIYGFIIEVSELILLNAVIIQAYA
jgi:cobalamin 5'-phosphate synthase/cobalamin synthase